MLWADDAISLKLKLGGAAATTELPVTGCYTEVSATGSIAGFGVIHTITTGGTAISIVGVAAAGNLRKLQGLRVVNVDTAAATVTIYQDSGTARNAIVVTLPVGYQLNVFDTGAWEVRDANGAVAGGGGSLTLTSDVTGSGSGSIATTIANDAVTYAKLQNISATARVLGRKTSGAGDTEECTASEILDFLGSTQGNILYRGASAWAPLATGTSGYFLKTQGAGANPVWAALTQDTILLQHQTSSGVDAGTCTSGAWRTVPLTNEVYDTGSNCSLSSNQFTLAAGTYEAWAISPYADTISRIQCRIYNTTGSTALCYGHSAYSSGAIVESKILGDVFTVAASQVLELQQQVAVTGTTFGFGVANSFGNTNIHAQVFLRRLS